MKLIIVLLLLFGIEYNPVEVVLASDTIIMLKTDLRNTVIGVSVPADWEYVRVSRYCKSNTYRVVDGEVIFNVGAPDICAVNYLEYVNVRNIVLVKGEDIFPPELLEANING
jgi:hypothetical protein